MSDESSKVTSVKQTVSILNQVVQKLDEHDHISAQVMVGVAIQMLERVKTELNHHLDVEVMLSEMLSNK